MSTAEKQADPDLPMMKGSSGGMDYLMFATKDGFGLGIKPNIIATRDGKTFVGSRLRVAKVDGETAPNFDQLGVVVSINAKKLMPSQVFHKLTDWEKDYKEYCSTAVGIWLAGTLETDANAVIAEFEDKKLSTKFADYLVSLVDNDDQLTMTREQLIDWLETIYQPIVTSVKQQVIEGTAFNEVLDKNVNNFGIQKSLLKQAKKAVSGHSDDEIAHEQVDDLEDDAFGQDDEDDDNNN